MGNRVKKIARSRQNLKSSPSKTTDHCIVIGIGGVSNSGKTTLSEKLKKTYENQKAVKIIHLDNYLLRANLKYESTLNGFDYEHPDTIDFKKIIEEINIQKNFYDLIIVEGFLVFYNDLLSNHLDKGIFILIDKETFLKRRLANPRNKVETNNYLEHIWNSFLKFGKVNEPFSIDMKIIENNEGIINILNFIEDDNEDKLELNEVLVLEVCSRPKLKKVTEAVELSAFFKKAQIPFKIITNDETNDWKEIIKLNKKRLEKLIQNSGSNYLHFAMHGNQKGLLIDYEDHRLPLEILTWKDLSNLRGLEGKAIISGACESGEFANSFLKAGAKVVIASNEKIPWKNLGKFFTEIYTLILEGNSLTNSLISTRIRHPEYSSYKIYHRGEEVPNRVDGFAPAT